MFRFVAAICAMPMVLAVMSLAAMPGQAAEYPFRFEWRNGVQYIVNQNEKWITVGWTDEGQCRRGCTTTPISPGEYRAFPKYRGRVATMTCIESHIVRHAGNWACRR